MKIKWLSISVAVMLLLFLLVQFYSPALTSLKVEALDSRQTSLQYHLQQKKTFSLDIYESDYLRNAVVLSNLIGTLFKADNFGKYPAYLVKTVRTSADKKRWEFTLHDGLECEDGEKITASSYAINLTESLKRYKRKSSILEFEKLIESKKLSKSSTKSIKGIRTESNKLILEFDESPEQLTSRLADSYFGYICTKNFSNDTLTWKDKYKIISSGAFKLKQPVQDRLISIELRENFPLSSSSTIRNVDYTIGLKDRKNLGQNYVSILSKLPSPVLGKIVTGVPTFSVNLSIPAGPDNVFSDLNDRRYFLKRLYELKQKNHYSDESTTHANNFFPLDTNDYFSGLSESKPRLKRFSKTKVVKISLTSSLAKQLEVALIPNIKIIGKEMNFKLERYQKPDQNFSNSSKSKPYDLRVTSVDLDSVPYFSLLDMIFCSEMGARYPDPGGKICNFVANSRVDWVGPLNSSQRNKFHNLIIDSAVMIPIAHRALIYQFSDSIDLNSVSGSAMWPRPDLIKFK